MDNRDQTRNSELTRFTIPADRKRIQEGIDPISSLLNEKGADKKIIFKIALALEEILTNVASYAYAPNTGNIDIEYGVDENRTLTVRIIDEGKEFDPLKNEDPDITLSAEDRQIGGLGIFIVKQTMDETTYERKDNKNILTLKKVV